MKKSFLIVCAAAAAVFGCKNTFIGDYSDAKTPLSVITTLF